MALPSLFNGQWVVGHSENFSASITTIAGGDLDCYLPRHAGADDFHSLFPAWVAPVVPAPKI
ncbi:high-affinity branched-chain amino acid ABC transporter permease [Escherichia coli]|uniref:High-affinity branched-chain amino acid ABC transporter permease n=1 Tax=Escherichia coli TaxID=562 RepID=A0A377BVH6_ECOLX|nr:high-affinity branched-chain amino acid ABC transporter permease [Escherichia coli]